MTPAKIRDTTREQLKATFLAMTSAEWVLDLDDQPADVQHDAAVKLLAVQHARLSLDNAELADIRDKLVENEQELDAGRKALAKALQDLDRVATVLGAVTGFLQTVGKVLPLLSIL